MQTPFVVSLGRRTADLSASNHERPFDKLRSTRLFEANGILESQMYSLSYQA